MPNSPKPYVEIPEFNIIRSIADQADAEARLNCYDDFFDEHGLDDYKTFDFGKSGLLLLGNKHLVKAMRESRILSRIPDEDIRDRLMEGGNASAALPLDVTVQGIKWLPRGPRGFIFAAMVEPHPIVEEHAAYVRALSKLANVTIWLSDDSNHIPLAYCHKELTLRQAASFFDITPHSYSLLPAAAISTAAVRR